MNTPITADKLKEILRLHALWAEGAEGGKRADLSEADLRGADLRGADLSRADLREADLSCADLSEANLSCANLRGANLILIGQDIRGHLFWAYQDEDGTVVLRAGCREFVGIAAARAHWQASHESDPILHEDCLSLVDRAERMAKVRGWLLEPATETEAQKAK